VAHDPAPTGLLEIGRIGRPHGVKGDLLVSFTSDVEERRCAGAEYTVMTAGATATLVIAAIRPQGERFVVHFEDVDDRTAAERLVNKLLWAAPLDGGDGIWVHELIGSSVVEVSGVERGTCTSVIDNPAHDILELSDGSLVPATFIVSCAEGTIVIDPPEGLFDLA
jgi:16S rRNA processing protein RimM